MKHIHIIGICGVATGAVAVAFKNAGWKVTGSDKGFYPPVSLVLRDAGVDFYAGWHPKKMITAESRPDLVVIGNASGSQNPETVLVKKENIPSFSEAEIRGQYFAGKNNIVCAGTWGKTSSTALLAHILKEAGLNPSFVIGGIPSVGVAARFGNGDWSVIEGDEYKSSPWDNRPKFAHFLPTHLLLSAVSWDHLDLYPDENSYFKIFNELVASVPVGGVAVVNTDDKGVERLLSGIENKPPLISYGKNSSVDYRYQLISQSPDGISLEITHQGEKWFIHSLLLGGFQAENIAGCFAMAKQIGLPTRKIIEAIGSFVGLKRRLEKRLVSNITVIDDIAHSPEKVMATLRELRTIYPKGKIVAIFEPNIGARTPTSRSQYKDAFKDADLVLIPRLTKLKIADDDREEPMDGEGLARVISVTHSDTKYIESDEELVDVAVKTAISGDVIVFLGSHGFRGMIEEAVGRLTNE